MHPLLALCLVVGVGAYVVGKRKGRPLLFTALSVPASFAGYAVLLLAIA